MLKPLWWVFFIVMQAAFVAAGLGIVFWTMNTWEEDRRLDAIFGAGLGAYAFLLAWRVIRRWALDHISLWKPQTDQVEPPPTFERP